MKYIEVESTWNVFLEVIEKFFSEIIKFDPVNINCDKDIVEDCKNLAEYSTLKDMGNGVKSNIELSNLEKAGEIVNSYIFVRLARHFYLLGIVEERETKALCDALNTIHAFLGNQYYYRVNVEIIKRLLLCGIRYSQRYDYLSNKYDERMAFSTRYLIDLGFELSVKQGTISYSEETGQRLFDLLERKIETIGGNEVIEKIIKKNLSKCYIPEMDRYLYGRKFDDGKNVPFNLLLQLSAKHLRLKWESYLIRDKEEYVNEIIKFAEAILDICDIQGTSGVEYSMMNSECFPIYLINEMIFDKICVAQQYSAKFILMSLDYLIKPWFSYAKTNYSYEDYYKVTKYVLNIQALCGKLNIGIMKKETGVALYLLRQILRDVSIPANEVNKEFVSLDSKTNLFTKPMIAFPLENYIFLEEHFCGIGFLNAAIDMIRKNYRGLGREQGGAVEKMLRDEMQKKGFGIKGGNYREKNYEKGGECDIVLEDSKLAFIEIKKKYITDELDILV